MSFEFVEPDEFEQRLIGGLRGIRVGRDDRGWSNSQWTKQIKSKLENMGETDGWNVYPKQDKSHREWLLDMVWCEEKETSQGVIHMTDIKLAVESEWIDKINDIRDDFEKLVVTKASYKLMIFSSKTADVQQWFEYMREGINAFKRSRSHERYLLAAYAMGKTLADHEFKFKSLSNA